MTRTVVAIALLVTVAALSVGRVVSLDAQQQPITFNQPARATAAWTSGTAINTALTVTTAGFSSVVITLTGSATLQGQITFEGDDGSGVWFQISAQREDTGVSDQAYLLAPVNQAWVVDSASWLQLRVRLSQPISGTGTANLAITMSAATESNPAPIAQTGTTTFAPWTAAASRGLIAPSLTSAMPSIGLLGTFRQPVGSIGDALKVWQINAFQGDPCTTGAKGNVAISQTANAQLLTNGAGSKRIAICSILIVGADAENLSLVEGTGATCGTGTAAVIGGATAANGPNLAANGGFAAGNGGGTIAVTVTAGDNLCLFQSGSGRVAGNLTYAYQ